MELAIELFNTLESLEAKGMHKQADQLANTMIRMAQEGGSVMTPGIDAESPIPKAVEAPVATSTLSIEEKFLYNYRNSTKGFTNQQKLRLINNYLTTYPNHSQNFKLIFKDLLQALSKEAPNKTNLNIYPNLKNAIAQNGLLDDFKKVNWSLLSNNELDLAIAKRDLKLSNNTDPNVIRRLEDAVAKAQQKVDLEKTTLPAGDAINNLKKAEEALEAAKKAGRTGDEIKALEEAVETAKATGSSSSKAQVEEAVSVINKISNKIPVLKSILPFLGKALNVVGTAGVVFGAGAALAGLVGDFNKYSWEEIMDDSVLSMRFGNNLILVISAIAQLVPIPGLGFVIGMLEFGIQKGFDAQYKAVAQRQKESLEDNLSKARKHVEYLIATNPKIKLNEIIDDVNKFYTWSASHSIINKKALEEFKNVEIPKMLEEAKSKNTAGQLLNNIPAVQTGGGMSGNYNKETGKWEFKAMANNRENRIMVASLISAAREYERQQRYLEADYIINATKTAFG